MEHLKHITKKEVIKRPSDIEEDNNKFEDKVSKKPKISGNSIISSSEGIFAGYSKALAKIAEDKIFGPMAEKQKKETSDKTITSLNERMFFPKDFLEQGEYTREILKEKITDLVSKKTLFLKTTKLHRPTESIPIGQHNECDRLRSNLQELASKIQLLQEKQDQHLDSIKTIINNTSDINKPLSGDMHKMAKEISQYSKEIDNLSLELENVHENYANEFNRNQLHEYLADNTTDLYQFYDTKATSHWRAKAKVYYGMGENDDLSDEKFEEYKGILRERSGIMLENREMCTNAEINAIKGIINDNIFKTLFETKTSQGSTDLVARADEENALFGYDTNLPDILRPKYGFLSSNPYKKASNLYLDGYGPFTIIYDKEEIKGQTTVTFTDSLALGNSRTQNHLYVRPALFTEPHEGIFPLIRWHNGAVIREPDEPLSKYKSIDDLHSYAEIQIHKILRPKHIKEVISSKIRMEQEIDIKINDEYKNKLNTIMNDRSLKEPDIEKKFYTDIRDKILNDTEKKGFCLALAGQIQKVLDPNLRKPIQKLLEEWKADLPKLVSEMEKEAREHLSKKNINLHIIE